MTVEELIERLKQFDPKLPVTITDTAMEYYSEWLADEVSVHDDEYEALVGQEHDPDGTVIDVSDTRRGPHVRIG